MWNTEQYATEANRIVKQEEIFDDYDRTGVATVYALLAIAAAIDEATDIQIQTHTVPVTSSAPKRGLFRWL